MEFPTLVRRVFIGVALVVAAGCGGSQPSQGSSGVLPAVASFDEHSPRVSWMVPDAKRRDLLYISDFGNSTVDVFTYPKGKKVGTLTGFNVPESLCSDHAGDVFVVDQSGPLDVYAHGGTSPIRELTTQGTPAGCSVDRATGNLAVTNEMSTRYGVVTVYADAAGSGKIYTDGHVAETFFCAYDNKGNLFIDGWSKQGEFILLELAKGARRFRITQLQGFDNLGGVEWDGQYVAVGDEGAGVIYRIDPTTGQVVQTVSLNSGAYINQFWIRHKIVVATDFKAFGTVSLWPYPAGGDAKKTLTGFDYPSGATISVGAR